MGLVVGFPNKSLQFPSKKDLTVDYKSQIFGQVTPTLPGQKPCKIPHNNASHLVCAVSTKRYFFMCIYFLWLPNILLITWITEHNQLPLCRAQSCLLVKGCLHEICGSAVGSGTGSFESCGMKDSGLYQRGWRCCIRLGSALWSLGFWSCLWTLQLVEEAAVGECRWCVSK